MHVPFTIEQVTPANGVNVSLVRELLEIWCEKDFRWVQSQAASTPALWEQVRKELSGHLCTLWVTGFLQGVTRKEGFYVRCDQISMTQSDIENGRVICEVGLASVEPAEFVIFRISLRLKSYRQVNARHRDGSLIA
jgi:Bacteriophage tail sheath protein